VRSRLIFRDNAYFLCINLPAEKGLGIDTQSDLQRARHGCSRKRRFGRALGWV